MSQNTTTVCTNYYNEQYACGQQSTPYSCNPHQCNPYSCGFLGLSTCWNTCYNTCYSYETIYCYRQTCTQTAPRTNACYACTTPYHMLGRLVR
jgi:hypothetical protein